MKLVDLSVHITQINNSMKLGCSHDKYGLRVNKFLKIIIAKLQKDNLIDQVEYSKNTCSFRPCNISHFKKLDRLQFNCRNYKKIYNQYRSPYTGLLVTTSKGIFTLEEAKEQNLGGLLLAKYTKKYQNNNE